MALMSVFDSLMFLLYVIATHARRSGPSHDPLMPNIEVPSRTQLSSGSECACMNSCSRQPGLQVPQCSVGVEAANKLCLLQHSGLYVQVVADEQGGFHRECERPEGHHVLLDEYGGLKKCALARLEECIHAKYDDVRAHGLACQDMGLAPSCTAFDMACAQLQQGDAAMEFQRCELCRNVNATKTQKLEIGEMCAVFPTSLTCSDYVKRKFLRTDVEGVWYTGNTTGTEFASLGQVWDLRAQCEEVVSAGWRVFEVERLFSKDTYNKPILINPPQTSASMLERFPIDDLERFPNGDFERGFRFVDDATSAMGAHNTAGNNFRLQFEPGHVPRHPVLGFPVRYGGAYAGGLAGFASGLEAGALTGNPAVMMGAGALGFGMGVYGGLRAGETAMDRLTRLRMGMWSMQPAHPQSLLELKSPSASCLPHSPKCDLVLSLSEGEAISGREDKAFYGALLDILDDGSEGYKLARDTGRNVISDAEHFLPVPSQIKSVENAILNGLIERASGGDKVPEEAKYRAKTALERIKNMRPSLFHGLTQPISHGWPWLPTCPGCSGFSSAEMGTVDRAIDTARMGASYVPSRFTVEDEMNARNFGIEASEAMDSAVIRHAGTGLQGLTPTDMI